MLVVVSYKPKPTRSCSAVESNHIRIRYLVLTKRNQHPPRCTTLHEDEDGDKDEDEEENSPVQRREESEERS
jgi:hypothetical protein